MPGEYTGGGNPARSVELLWGIRGRGARGPTPGMSARQITAAAVELADAEGLDGVSMRRIAQYLGTGTMSLYRYIPGKSELLDLMVDQVSGEAVQPAGGAAGWRARLEQVARANRRIYERHPWLLRVFPVRPPLGPGVIAKYDAELRAVEGIGLNDVEMDSVLSLVLGYVHEATADLVEAAQAQQRTGLTDDEWWQAAAPAFAEVFDAERYPVAARVGAAATAYYRGASDPVHAFEFGLQRLLDGVEAFVRRRKG